MRKILLIFIIYLLSITTYGQGVITGNRTGWSEIRTTINSNFDTLFKRTEFVSVKEFGAIGDGITDDRTVIQAAFDYAETNNKGVIFSPDSFYISDYITIFDGASINWNGGKFLCEANAFALDGSSGSFYDGTNDVYKGSSFITIDNSVFVNSLSAGDYIKIIDDFRFTYDNNNNEQKNGEIHKIKSIQNDSIIELCSPLNSTYTIARNVKISKLVMKTFTSIGTLNVIGVRSHDIDGNSLGSVLSLSFVHDLDVKLVSNEMTWSAVSITNSYCNKLDVTAHTLYVNDYGGAYGVAYGGVNFLDITGVFHCRHATSTSPTGDEYGSVCNVTIHDAKGFSVFGDAVFDSHRVGGSSIVYDNCIAYGGARYLYNSIIYTYSDLETYNDGDIVSYEDQLFVCNNDNTLGIIPANNISGKWDVFASGTGFDVGSGDWTLNNCKVIDVYFGVVIHYDDNKSVKINNFTAENTNTAIYVSENDYLDLIIDGVYAKNKYYNRQPMIQTAGSYNSMSLNNLSSINQKVLHLGDSSAINLTINNINTKNDALIITRPAIYIGSSSLRNLTINNIKADNHENLIEFSNIDDTVSLYINNISVDSVYHDVIYSQRPIKDLIVNSGYVKNVTNDNLVRSTKSVDNLVISNISYDGDTIIDIDGVFGTFIHTGNIFNIGVDQFNSKPPTTTKDSGSIGL